MRRTSVILGAVLALLAAPAAAQQFRHELSFFGSVDNMDEPEQFDTTILNLRYGHFFTEQLVGTLGLQHSRFKGRFVDVSTSVLSAGAKYYFGPLARATFVPFVEASLGLASADVTGSSDTDLAWEIGGGAAFFMTDATSLDVSLRWYHTDTSVKTEGLRVFLGLATRF